MDAAAVAGTWGQSDPSAQGPRIELPSFNGVLDWVDAAMSAAAEDLREGLVVQDLDGTVLRANAAARRLIGGQRRFTLLHPAGTRLPLDVLPAAVVLRDGVALPETRLGVHTPNGETRWVATWAEPLHGPDGSLRGVLTCFVDETELRAAHVALAEAEERNAALASADPLTGLPNRVAAGEAVLDVLHTPGASRTALLLVGIDRFQQLNDSHGTAAGDALLVAAARRLRSLTRGGDLVARLGSDEFLVVASDVGNEVEAGILGERLRSALALPHDLGGVDPVSATASIGIAFVADSPRTGDDPADVAALLRQVALALSTAKGNGRDRVAVFDATLRAIADERGRAERRLRRALNGGWLALEYQPVVDLASGRIVGAEALVRLDDPEEGRLPPAAFIDIAEETGLITAVDEWVVGAAVRQAAAWAVNGETPALSLDMVAVNVSARSLADPRFSGRLARLLSDHGVSGGALHVELTERTLVDTSAYALDALARLGELGVHVGIDDFGTGYSALAYLHRFALDFVKIDRGFTSRLTTDARTHAIVRAVVELAHALGLVVVAEGVETAEELEHLRRMGCDRVQGFLVARPLRPEILEALVREGRRVLPEA